MMSGGDGVYGVSKYLVETVYVPPGAFQMGSGAPDTNERPAHTVTLTNGTHWMTTEFTNGHMEELKKRRPGKFDHMKTMCELEPRGL